MFPHTLHLGMLTNKESNGDKSLVKLIVTSDKLNIISTSCGTITNDEQGEVTDSTVSTSLIDLTVTLWPEPVAPEAPLSLLTTVVAVNDTSALLI